LSLFDEVSSRPSVIIFQYLFSSFLILPSTVFVVELSIS
jgi:hypothetical protein